MLGSVLITLKLINNFCNFSLQLFAHFLITLIWSLNDVLKIYLVSCLLLGSFTQNCHKNTLSSISHLQGRRYFVYWLYSCSLYYHLNRFILQSQIFSPFQSFYVPQLGCGLPPKVPVVEVWPWHLDGVNTEHFTPSLTEGGWLAGGRTLGSDHSALMEPCLAPPKLNNEAESVMLGFLAVSPCDCFQTYSCHDANHQEVLIRHRTHEAKQLWIFILEDWVELLTRLL